MTDRLVAYAKKYPLPIGAGILLIVILASWYRWGIYPADPAEAIPDNTAFVFKPSSPKSKDYQYDSISYPGFLQFFPMLLRDFQYMQALAGDSHALFTVDNLGEGQYALAAVVNGGRPEVLDSLYTAYHRSTSSYLGANVRQLVLPEGTLAYTRYRNLLLLGRIPLQVEQQLAQLINGKPLSAKVFPSDTRAAIFTENIPAFLTGFWKGSALAASRSWADQQARISIDWSTDSTGIRISGSGLPVSGLDPADSSAYRILPYLPAELAWCKWAHFNLPASGNPLFDEHIRPWLGNDKAVFQLPLPGGIAENEVVLLRTLDPSITGEQLATLGEEGGTLERYTFQLFTVQRLYAEGLLAPLGIAMDNPYTVVLGDYVAISQSRAALEQTANAYLLSQHLATTTGFQEAWLDIADASAKGWLYFNGKLGRSRIQEWLSGMEEVTLDLFTAYPTWAGSWGTDGQFQLFGCKAEEGVSRPLVTPLWTAPLPLGVATPPYAYPEGGFLLQDKTHQLYFFNEKGGQRWSYPLEETIIGGLEWVDYFETGPPCIAFTTSRQVWVLDPNGNPVGRYPQPWPSPALSPLLVAKMEGERTFRLFTGTDDGIYGFTKEGQLLPAWSPYSKLDSTVRLAMQYQQFEQEDYMSVLTESGTLYNLRRDGQLRFDSLALGAAYRSVFSSPPYLQADQHQQRIAIGDKQGFVHVINFQGTHFRLQVLPGADDACFRFEQLLGDARRDYLAWDNDRLVLYFYKGQSFIKQLDYRFPSPPSAVFVVDWSGDSYIGWCSAEAQRVHLLDLNGQEVPGFPLAGNTPFITQKMSDGSTLAILSYGQRVYGYRLE